MGLELMASDVGAKCLGNPKVGLQLNVSLCFGAPSKLRRDEHRTGNLGRGGQKNKVL